LIDVPEVDGFTDFNHAGVDRVSLAVSILNRVVLPARWEAMIDGSAVAAKSERHLSL